MRWLTVFCFLLAEIPPRIDWTILALVAAPTIPGWVSLHLPHSWLMYCCCSTSAFLPFWQGCGPKQPINLLRLWASVPDPGSPVCTCNTCNSNMICPPGLRCFGLWTLHPKKYIQLFDRSLRFSLKFYYNFHWVFFFGTSKSYVFFFSSPSEEHAQQLKEKAGWSMQIVSSVGAAGREAGQQEGCGRARASCPQLPCGPSLLKRKHSRSPRSSLVGLAEFTSWNHSIT